MNGTRKRWLFSKIALAGQLGLILALSIMMAGCNQTTESATQADESFTYWIGTGENSAYYLDYRDNPVIKYLLSQTYAGENGVQKTLDFSFMVPPAGGQSDSFTTLISTGEYLDIMDSAYYSGSVVELYDSGIVLDMTYYVENYMPNYLAFLADHPGYALTATNLIDGERKYIQLYSMAEFVSEPWLGFSYRRDWIAKYGEQPATFLVDADDPTQGTVANPNAGTAFSGEYVTTETGKVWQDDILFPNGTSEPLYISDWEWMFEIFEEAIAGEGIIGGYGYSPFYPGYIAPGDLVSSFGGGGATWYMGSDGNIHYGPKESHMRAYLQCLNTWYDNGWIDEAFPEHTSELFWETDDTKVRQGKVGLWLGTSGQLMDKLDISDGNPNSPTNGYTNGICVYGASLPVNDIYGEAENQYQDPYCFFHLGGQGFSIIITDKAADKDLVALCSFLDYMYSEEGSVLRNGGLSQEQYEETHDEFYTQYGLTEGAYYVVDDSNPEEIVYQWVPELLDSERIRTASTCSRIFGRDGLRRPVVETMDWYFMNDLWAKFQDTGNLTDPFVEQLALEDSMNYSRTQRNLGDFLQRNIPNFITGNKDPFSDAEWTAYVNAINKFNPNAVTEDFQALLDLLRQED